MDIRTFEERDRVAVVNVYAALGYGNDNVVSLGKRLEKDNELNGFNG